MAYQLLKIKPKDNGNFRASPFNKFALLSESQNSNATTTQQAVEMLHEAFDISGQYEQSDNDVWNEPEVWRSPRSFENE